MIPVVFVMLTSVLSFYAGVQTADPKTVIVTPMIPAYLVADCPTLPKLDSGAEPVLPDWVAGIKAAHECERAKRAGLLEQLSN